MQSRLIPQHFDDPKAEHATSFARHLGEVLALSQTDLDKCLAALPEVRLANTPKDESELLDRLDKACSAGRPNLAHALKVLYFFVGSMLKSDLPDDDYKHWVDDLLDQQIVESARAEGLRGLLERLVTEQLPALRPLDRKRQAATGVLPKFKTIGYTAELRSVREGIYRWGTDVGQYEPEILGTVQVASIHLGVDRGPFDDIYFQVEEDGVDYMISTLQAIKKDWAALRKYLRVSDDVGSGHNA